MEDPRESYCSDSSVGKLIKQLTLMLKHPAIDSNLSEVLEDFLAKLHESDKYLENGICNTNFVESAFFLQNAVAVYGKRVDLLWDSVIAFHKQLVLSTQKTNNTDNEIMRIEERQHKFRRKRKKDNTNDKLSASTSSFSFGGSATTGSIDYLSHTYESQNLLDTWHHIDDQTIEHTNESTQQSACTEKHDVIFQPHNAIHNMEDGEYLGRYDQIHSNTLITELFHLDKLALIVDSYNCIRSLKLDSHVINDFLYEHKITSDQNREKYVQDLSKYVSNFIHGIKNQTPNHCQEPIVNLIPLPIQVIQDKLKRISVSECCFSDSAVAPPDNSDTDSLLNECSTPVSTINTDNDKVDCALDKEPCDDVTAANTKRNVSCSQDSAFYDCDDVPEDNDDLEDCTLSNRQDVDLPIASSTPKHSQTTDTPIFTGCSVIIPRISVKSKLVFDKVKVKQARKVTPKKMKFTQKALERLSTGVTVSCRQFEQFYRLHYKRSNGEGGFQSEDVSDDDDDDDESQMDVDNSPNIDEDVNNNSGDKEIEEEEHETADSGLIKSAFNDLNISSIQQSDYTISDQQADYDSSSSDTNEEAVERSDSVGKWKSFIKPLLRKVDERSDFNIHEYESNIIDSMEINEQKHFKNIVNNKPASEVVRFFIATLQLANTNNIEIIDSNQCQLANETLEIKLLDKTRHHELLEDYEAPSIGNLKKNLSKIKTIRSKGWMEATSSSAGSGQPRKKLKLSSNSQRNLF